MPLSSVVVLVVAPIYEGVEFLWRSPPQALKILCPMADFDR